jgi:hypothetical protein
MGIFAARSFILKRIISDLSLIKRNTLSAIPAYLKNPDKQRVLGAR